MAAVPAWVPWLPVSGELLWVGLTSVLPVEDKLDVDDADEGGGAELVLPDADADAVALALGPAVLAGLELEAGQGLPVAFLPLGALAFAVADADVVALLVALLLAVAVAVAVAEAVPVAEELALSLGLALGLPLPGLSLVLPLAGVVPEPAGLTLGVGDLLDLADLAAVDDEEGDGGQAVAFALL